MATADKTKKSCYKCNKVGATFTCDGCHQSFCLKHTSDHRQELSQQMDNIGQEYDVLRRDIDCAKIKKMFLDEIDRWEKESIAKIQFSAEKSRIDLKRLEEESKCRLNSLMNKLSTELRSNQETDDYTEDDLIRWVNQLKELRQELERPSEIEIEEDKSSIFCLIKTKKKNADRENVFDLPLENVALNMEKFINETGPILLSEGGHSAICTSDIDISHGLLEYSSVCGSLQYSHGVYNIRLRLHTSRNSAIFFGILPSSQPISNQSTVLKSVYGYWSDGRSVRAGCPEQLYRKIKTQSNDTALFILDCSSSKITYVHDRTQQHQEITVDQKICPFPWKLVVTLWHPKDQIEILNS